MTPKISIITPVYNGAQFIADCVASVGDQTFPNIEHIIVDGLSTDNTLEIVRKFDDNSIKIISESDNGIYDAMNKGIERANGEWLYFMGSDDMLYSDNVINDIMTKCRAAKYDIIYGNVILKHSGKIYDGRFNSYKLLNRNVCHQAIFYRSTVFERLGKYDLKYSGVADWVFNMKCFSDHYLKIKYIDKIMAIYNEDGYCFNNRDDAFFADRDDLNRKYFSKFVQFIYKNRDNKLVSHIIDKYLLR